jgi:G3E family GTPase
MPRRAPVKRTKPHVILIAGFLGAGKTTAMLALARWLADQGIRAGFITNDQGRDLVDTRLLEYCGFPSEEIAGGCFCCRFDELVDATRRLRAALQPDVFVAEAVGSCTDLAATVTYPMRRLLGNECTVAPLSVLVDPVRAQRAFGLGTGETFADNVQYIYRKQLEEADVIVIGKCDLLPVNEIEALRAVLQREFPHAELLVASSREETGLDYWFRRIVFGEQRQRPVMDVDYDRYADGEGRLGWLNGSVTVVAPAPDDGNVLLQRLASDLQRRLDERGAMIAHLKMTLHAGDRLAAVNLVRNDVVPELAIELGEPILTASLVVNLRAQAAPGVLEEALRESLAAMAGDPGSWSLELIHVEAFRPGRPEPTHRDGAHAAE